MNLQHIHTKQKSSPKFKSVKQLLNILAHPPIKVKIPKKRAPLDREAIRKTLKVNWKDSGYGNKQFERLNILKQKLLTEWQQSRIYLADRSYKYPKNYHGYKYDCYSRDFSTNQKDKLEKIKLKTQIQQPINKMSTVNVRKTYSGLKYQRSKDTLFGFPRQYYKLKTVNV